MQLRLISSALLALALLGCGSGSSSVNEDDGNDFAVNAQYNTEGITPGTLFQSNDVLATRPGPFGFSFVAVDGEWTIIISIQSLEAEPLDTGTYTIEANDTTRIVASASFVFNSTDGMNTAVYNAEEGGGAILLTSFDDVGAKGSFHFTAKSITAGSDNQVVQGNFDIKF